VQALTEGRGADYCFEVIGAAETVSQALAVVRRGGTAVVIGQPARGVQVGVEVQQLVLQEKSLVASLYGTTVPYLDVPMLLGLYVAGKLKLDELITREYPIDEINEAFAALERGEVARSIVRFG
jgi:S-(hydroxymethyl)glutathione dehydrogenase/alcohol dehydrogenase